MQKRVLFLIFLAMATLGCHSVKEEKKAESPAPVEKQTFLGTISSVNQNGHFVLIDFGGFTVPAAGSELQVRRAGVPVATLQAGSEMRRPFAVADILTGDPQEGDDVWSKNP